MAPANEWRATSYSGTRHHVERERARALFEFFSRVHTMHGFPSFAPPFHTFCKIHGTHMFLYRILQVLSHVAHRKRKLRPSSTPTWLTLLQSLRLKLLWHPVPGHLLLLSACLATFRVLKILRNFGKHCWEGCVVLLQPPLHDGKGNSSCQRCAVPAAPSSHKLPIVWLCFS
jgi:hypothetical protein